MSRSTSTTLTCPCGTVFTSPIYEYVNVAKDPPLLYTVLAGLLNVSTCPSCGRRAAVSRPFMFSDPQHNLLAYVHPREDAPQEARLLILEKLRNVYETVVGDAEAQDDDSEMDGAPSSGQPGAAERSLLETPPLRVVFGLDSLYALINSTLTQDERLGKIALNTRSRDTAERGRLHDIARKLALEMGCQIEVEDLSDDYTVWIMGPRRQVGAIMRELAARS